MSPPPSFSPLATYQDGGAGVVFKEKQKKKEGRKENSPSTVPIKHVQDSQSYKQADLIVLFPAFFILQIYCFICRLFTDTQLLLFISSSG